MKGQPYRKLYVRLWTHPVFQSLPVRDQLVTLYVLTRGTNRAGLCHIRGAIGAAELGMRAYRFRQSLERVCTAFAWRFDRGHEVVWIPSWWKWNPPENPSVLVGNLKDLEQLPQTSLLDEYVEHVDGLPHTCHHTFRETCRRRLGHVSVDSATDSVAESGDVCPHVPPDVRDISRTDNREQRTYRKIAKGTKRSVLDTVPRPRATRARETDAVADGFALFWDAYPKKRGKDAAEKAWLKKGLTAKDLPAVLTAIETQARHHDWRREGGQYIPHPATWLNQGRWKDELDEAPRTMWSNAQRLVADCPHDPPCTHPADCRLLLDMEATEHHAV